MISSLQPCATDVPEFALFLTTRDYGPFEAIMIPFAPLDCPDGFGQAITADAPGSAVILGRLRPGGPTIDAFTSHP